MTPVTPPHERKAAKTCGLIGRAGFEVHRPKNLSMAILSRRSGSGVVLLAGRGRRLFGLEEARSFPFESATHLLRPRLDFVPGAAPRFLTVEAVARGRQEHAAGRLPNHSLDDSRQDRPEETAQKGRRIRRQHNQVDVDRKSTRLNYS